ncbi:hypothetical protein L226DRAFT_575268 [Lentinus tigrinus ALCF2SS1-7]|nr:hypothetical protein L226DRAFT_575268 [Lentinus tigrinus ALCF2SS1-7]
MLFPCVALVLALVGAVRATPPPLTTTAASTTTTVRLPDGFPITDLSKDSTTAHPNVTVGEGGVHVDGVDAVNAILYLCQGSGCNLCTSYSLDSQPHRVCLTGYINFVSVYIYQPSDVGLPFGVYTGPSGCTSFAQVPAVNTCYNTVGYTGWDFELSP